jgi:hypothetical protein
MNKPVYGCGRCHRIFEDAAESASCLLKAMASASVTLRDSSKDSCVRS